MYAKNLFRINDIIIDHLHDDVSTLRQCSLVCKEWLPAARFHIFSVVHLSLYSIDQMLEVVFYPGSPIPQYIRDLHIIDGQGREFDPKWVNQKFSLVALSSMTCISSLLLEQVDFSGFSGATMAALRGITARVTRLELMYVRFKDLDGCLAFLGAAVSLRSLTSFITIFEAETWSSHPVIATILPELVELELEDDKDPLLDLSSFFDRTPSDMNAEGIDLSKNPNLKNIIFGPNSSQWIVKILDTAAPALERVYMQLPSDYFDFPSLTRIFMGEGSGLRRTGIILSNLDLGACSAIIGWLEDTTNEPGRIQVRDHEISLRDLRPEFM
ncbi:APH domain-containing protein [Mycena venus]|uniref:APH domain-containing protein n=1 Tax=Mycena venus TaxID=2733690 RepID=A0A8H6X3M5_9AGAR|nr:APH domain-containing protein [Mycena venus]